MDDFIDEEEEFLEFKKTYSKPEFSCFENSYFYDYFDAMGVSRINQLLETPINDLVQKAEGHFFSPGRNKIAEINKSVLENFGHELKGIEDYLPVPVSVKKILKRLGINKLGDCLGHSLDELWVKGINANYLTDLNKFLLKYHYREMKGSPHILERMNKCKN